MRYFIDTEFYEDGQTIDLISIGIVSDGGAELYLENAEFDWYRAPPGHWLHDNVRPHMQNGHSMATKAAIAQAVRAFCGYPTVFYGYFADYDWVVFCQLFGTMADLPKGFPMYCRDLKQTMDELDLSDEWKRQHCPDPEGEHNALVDARWNMSLYGAIMRNL